LLFDKFLYLLSKASARRSYIPTRRLLCQSANWTVAQIAEYQDAKVREIVDHVFRIVPFYVNLMSDLHITASDFTSVASLRKLPLIDKSVIKENMQLFVRPDGNLRFIESSSGGSTGEPLKYRMSEKNALYSSLLLDRGLNLGGYVPGDRLAIIAGGSLVGKEKTIKKRLIERLTNVRYFSSYGMDEVTLGRYAKALIDFQPQFLRGYASALCALSTYIRSNNLSRYFNVSAVFSTSEMLIDSARHEIESAFGCPVFDGWGLNDGGATAFECSRHDGMHIDPERAYVEIVSDGATLRYGKDVGRVVVTNLIDEIMPFIRYDSGDIGRIDYSPCPCGLATPRLFLKYGRITDQITIAGSIVGAPVLTVLMGRLPVKQYQIAKTGGSSVTFRIIKDDAYSAKDEEFILRSMSERIAGVKVSFEYVDRIVPPKGVKHKFLIDETSC
jgi:phenylacetate-CoA ligase